MKRAAISSDPGDVRHRRSAVQWAAPTMTPESLSERGGTERRLWREHPGARRGLHAAVALSALAACAWFACALLLAGIVGRVFLHGAALGTVAVPLAAIAALVVARAALLWASETVAERSADDVERSLRERVVAGLFALGPAHVRGERAGELVHTAVGAAEALGEYVTGYRRARLLAGIVPALAAVVLIAVDPVAALIALAAWPVLVLLLALIGGRVRDAAERRERELAWLGAHFLDVIRGLPTLKLFGRSAEQADTIEAVGTRFGATTMDVLRTAFQASLVLEWGAVGATALVAIEASVRLMSGALPFEHALAALLLAPELFLPLRRYSAEYHAGQAGRAAAARIYAVLDTPVPARAGTGRRLPERFDLRFEHVCVAYDAGARPALRGFSLEVRHGATVALVGQTGAGKSTVAGVLLRFVEPDSGAVLVGGLPLRDLAPARWRTLVAWVPQHPGLFHGTVADNIRMARPDATDAEVVAAARTAHAHEFVSALPAGYDTPVGERGARLSGGERQRIALARAMLRDAPVLVLDEATSHLDPESEALVLQALARFRRGRTVIVITHRAGLARDADLVAVMHAGSVVEIGTPESLAS
jgi:ATP-binding cassette subfamily C protein CydD